jgi:anthranilate/para-aminobenzoate synthase component I
LPACAAAAFTSDHVQKFSDALLFCLSLCRVDNDRVVTNRPLAGTRRRGITLHRMLTLRPTAYCLSLSLCRVDNDRVVTNRPLAGTRRRGTDPAADLALEKELLADQKECAEHVMLVDLGRNDVGKVRSSIVGPGMLSVQVML